MKTKRLLRFYFYSEGINGAIDNLINKFAFFCDGYHDGLFYAEKVCELVGVKLSLGGLWDYIDGIICKFTQTEKNVLRFYGSTRKSIAGLSADSKREIKRVTVKFTRRVRLTERHSEALNYLNKYYCLICLDR